MALKHLLVTPELPISITNVHAWWLEGSSARKFSFALCTRFLRDVPLVLHSISYSRYFSEEDIGSTNPHMNCRDCKMQAGLYRLQSTSQRNTSPSCHPLIPLFSKWYLMNYIIHVRLSGFPPYPGGAALELLTDTQFLVWVQAKLMEVLHSWV